MVAGRSSEGLQSGCEVGESHGDVLGAEDLGGSVEGQVGLAA